MVMEAEPIYRCFEDICSETGGRPRVIYLTPQGAVFKQSMAEELAAEEVLVFLCGHYEGVDERVLEEIVTDYISIGDYVLTGGELPAMVLMDAIGRLVPGVLNNGESAETERVFLMGFWSIRSTRVPRRYWEGRFRKYFFPVIMKK